MPGRFDAAILKPAEDLLFAVGHLDSREPDMTLCSPRRCSDRFITHLEQRLE